MNNRGFTLIEVLAILVILSVIMGLAIPAFTSTMESSKNKNEMLYRDKLVDAAELYVADYKYGIYKNSVGSDQYFISTDELLSKGYISSSEVKDNIGGVVYSKSKRRYVYICREYNSDTDYFSGIVSSGGSVSSGGDFSC